MKSPGLFIEDHAGIFLGYVFLLLFCVVLILPDAIRGSSSPYLWSQYHIEMQKRGSGIADLALVTFMYLIFYSGFFLIPYFILKMKYHSFVNNSVYKENRYKNHSKYNLYIDKIDMYVNYSSVNINIGIISFVIFASFLLSLDAVIACFQHLSVWAILVLIIGGFIILRTVCELIDEAKLQIGQIVGMCDELEMSNEIISQTNSTASKNHPDGNSTTLNDGQDQDKGKP